jgi:hypothetical protein
VPLSIKQTLVNTFGGRCQLCGYNRCLGALVFHHRDPSEKDFNISLFRKRNVDNFHLIRELEKCVMLCANCHAEVHAGLWADKLAEIPESELMDDGMPFFIDLEA